MVIREIRAKANMDGFGAPIPINGVLFGGEEQAHKFVITAQGGATFSGSVSAKFLRYADNVTVPLVGSIEEDAATVTLIENCYARPGRFKLTVYVTEGESTTAVYCCMGTVDRTDGETTVDPNGEINLDVIDLINAIDAATASIPPVATALMAAIATTFSASTAYAAGQYVWYNGTLYQFTANHAAGAWTGTDATAVVVGEDVRELKSALTLNRKSTENSFEVITGNRALVFRPGLFKCFANGTTTIDTDTPITGTTVSDDTMTAICPCSPGDVFQVRAYGGSETACAYGFLNAGKAGISRGGANGLYVGTIVAPANAAYIIINNNITNNPDDFYAYKGESIVNDVDFVQESVAEIRTPSNIFTVENSDPGKYLSYSDNTLQTNSAYFVTDYIPVKAGYYYTYPVYTGLFGTSGNERKQHFYDSNKAALPITTGNRTNNILTVAAPSGAAYIRVTVKNTDAESFMLICGDTYPETYIAPGTIYLKDNVVAQKISDSAIKFINRDEVINLYNPDDSDIVTGSTIGYNGTSTTAQGFKYSGFIPIIPGATYIFPIYANYFGSSDLKYIPCYDESKTYAGSIQRAELVDTYFAKYTFASNVAYKYFRVNIATYDANSNRLLTPYHSEGNFMVLCGTGTMPGTFIPYGEQYKFDANYQVAAADNYNPLIGKKVVFLGDSICEAGTDDCGGWAGRIGNANDMLWENEGVGGSTIAYNTGVGTGKYICLKEIKMSDPDYIIFEGGTNDADHFGNATGETKPAGFGTWNETDYGTNDAETYYGFNIETFCGACDYLCKRLVTTYAGKKIGFIGAHKMGDVATTRANRGYYIQTAMDIAKKWGIPVLDLWHGCYLNSMLPQHYTSGQNYLYADSQHLYPKGYAYISPMIEAWMKTL